MIGVLVSNETAKSLPSGTNAQQNVVTIARNSISVSFLLIVRLDNGT